MFGYHDNLLCDDEDQTLEIPIYLTKMQIEGFQFFSQTVQVYNMIMNNELSLSICFTSSVENVYLFNICCSDMVVGLDCRAIERTQ